MSVEIIALILCFIAGMATMVGGLVVFFTKGKSEKVLSISLGLAAGVMISVSFLDLYPSGHEALAEVMNHSLSTFISVFALALGILVSASLDRFLPHEEGDHNKHEHKDLYRVGVLSMLAIGLHNFPEGIATFMSTIDDVSLGMTIMIAITLHNIPEGISVAIPIYYASGSKKKAFFYTFLSGIAEPVGAILAYLVLRPFITPAILGFILCFVAGLMIYIALEELLPESRQYGYSRLALYSLFIGILIMPMAHILH